MKGFGPLIAAGIGAAAGAAILGFANKAREAAAALEESESLFETSLGGMADDARAFSEESASALGINASEMRKNIGVMFNMQSSMGVSKDKALSMAKGLSQLTLDMGSFHDLESAEMFDKLKAGITGEAEPLKALGIILNVATLEQEALNLGITKGYQEMTEAEKVQVRFAAIMKQTSTAQGDLARTQESHTNQMRTLDNQLQLVTETIGSALIPIINSFLPMIVDMAKWLGENLPAAIGHMQDNFKKMKDVVMDVWESISDATETVAKGMRWLGKIMGNEVPSEAEIGAKKMAKSLGKTEDATEDVTDTTAIYSKALKTVTGDMGKWEGKAKTGTSATEKLKDATRKLADAAN